MGLGDFIHHKHSGEVANGHPDVDDQAVIELQGALDCLTQNATHPADVVSAIRRIRHVIDTLIGEGH